MVILIVPKQKHQMKARRRMVVIMVSKVFDDCDSGEYSILYPLASKATTHSGFVNPTKLQICPLVDIAVVATSLSYLFYICYNPRGGVRICIYFDYKSSSHCAITWRIRSLQN